MRRQFGPSRGNRRLPQRLPGRYQGPPPPQKLASGATRSFTRSGTVARITPPPTPRVQMPASGLLHHLTDLLTPGPAAYDIAQAAHVLGVLPKIEPPKVSMPKGLEHRTLGKPSVAQLVSAGQKGAVKFNDRGQITIPATRQAERALHQAQRLVDQTSGVQGPFTPAQKAFVERLAKDTGLSPRALGAQALAEESEGAAASREAAGNNDWLNLKVGVTPDWQPTIPDWSNPKKAADLTARTINTGPDYAGIRATRGKGAASQIAAIGASPWGTSGATMAQTLAQVSQRANPGAKTQLAQAVARAKRLGIPTKGTINGDVGATGSPGVVYVRADAKGMVNWAESALGVTEGSKREARWAAAAGISPSTPWCSAFIAAGLARRGIKPPPDPAYSGSWLNWPGGKHIGNIRQAKPGDLLIFDWGDGGRTDHVALYAGNGQMISGNDSNNSVGQSSVPASNIVGIVRPTYHGGKVPLRELTPLPGGSAGGVGGAVAEGGYGGEGGGNGGQETQRIPPALVSISTPGAAGAPLPEAFQQFQLGEAPSSAKQSNLSVINDILRRRRL